MAGNLRIWEVLKTEFLKIILTDGEVITGNSLFLVRPLIDDRGKRVASPLR